MFKDFQKFFEQKKNKKTFYCSTLYIIYELSPPLSLDSSSTFQRELVLQKPKKHRNLSSMRVEKTPFERTLVTYFYYLACSLDNEYYVTHEKYGKENTQVTTTERAEKRCCMKWIETIRRKRL